MRTEIVKAASLGPAAENGNNYARYSTPRMPSTTKLAQAAEALCLLAFWPLSATTRQGLLALLDRRLRRAYGGPSRG